MKMMCTNSRSNNSTNTITIRFQPLPWNSQTFLSRQTEVPAREGEVLPHQLKDLYVTVCSNSHALNAFLIGHMWADCKMTWIKRSPPPCCLYKPGDDLRKLFDAAGPQISLWRTRVRFSHDSLKGWNFMQVLDPPRLSASLHENVVC